MAERESRLRDLEMRFLGPPSEASSCPFAPMSAYKSRVEHFKSFSAATVSETSERKDMKLPAVILPSFDGQNLEEFLKNWERWLRLSGAQSTDDKFKIDW